jgi:adenylate cyclase
MNSFFAVIDELNSCSALERPALEARILRDFEQERAVLALDMSGYSFSVRRGGILPHLCRIRRMQQAATPLVERFGGEVVKQVADNILAIFREPRHAIDAAVAINQAVAASRAGEACDDSALLSVGIGTRF